MLCRELINVARFPWGCGKKFSCKVVEAGAIFPPFLLSEVMGPLKGILLGVLLLLGGIVGEARAQGNFGFGFILGEPTGLSWKYRTDRMNALDGAIGFSPFDRFRLHVDYLWHARPFRDPAFALHYGAGVAVGFGQTLYASRGKDGYFVRSRELGFALRVPFGIDYAIPRSPIEIFFEIAPLFILGPATGVGIDAGIGLRFYP
jgi:hypothetical protein